MIRPIVLAASVSALAVFSTGCDDGAKKPSGTTGTAKPTAAATAAATATATAAATASGDTEEVKVPEGTITVAKLHSLVEDNDEAMQKKEVTVVGFLSKVKKKKSGKFSAYLVEKLGDDDEDPIQCSMDAKPDGVAKGDKVVATGKVSGDFDIKLKSCKLEKSK